MSNQLVNSYFKKREMSLLLPVGSGFVLAKLSPDVTVVSCSRLCRNWLLLKSVLYTTPLTLSGLRRRQRCDSSSPVALAVNSDAH